jgi:pimeloyl-ACP methyl ester carboxylesterase
MLTISTVLIWAPTSASAGEACDRLSPASVDPGPVQRDRHPVVLVHGWTGSSKDMNPVAKEVEKRVPDTFTFRSFDYSSARTEWAASRRVASCLALYVQRVATEHRVAGGDGRVYVVAHSMGGLATRFATNDNYTDKVLDGTVLSGLTTIDTPHLGSPFGDTSEGDFQQWLDELSKRNLFPDRKSDAVHCLALHGRDRALPTGCAYPPYLPPQIPVAQITGDNVVQRTMFGIPMYDIDLRSDGVVSTNSGTGYLLGSGPPGETYPRAQVTDKEVSCTITSDNLLSSMNHVLSGNVKAAAVSAVSNAIPALVNDYFALDQINSGGKGGLNLELMLFATALVAPCSHSGMLTESRSMDAVAEALRKQIGTTTTQAAGKWTDPEVVVTTNSIGAAELGMSDDEIETAANVRFIKISCTDCDATPSVDLAPSDQYPLYFSSTIGSNGKLYRSLHVSLRNGQQHCGQNVVTDEGFLLGSSVDELRRIYGSRLKPFEALGMDTIKGYKVDGPDSYIIFNTANTNGKAVHEIWVEQRRP